MIGYIKKALAFINSYRNTRISILRNIPLHRVRKDLLNEYEVQDSYTYYIVTALLMATSTSLLLLLHDYSLGYVAAACESSIYQGISYNRDISAMILMKNLISTALTPLAFLVFPVLITFTFSKEDKKVSRKKARNAILYVFSTYRLLPGMNFIVITISYSFYYKAVVQLPFIYPNCYSKESSRFLIVMLTFFFASYFFSFLYNIWVAFTKVPKFVFTNFLKAEDYKTSKVVKKDFLFYLYTGKSNNSYLDRYRKLALLSDLLSILIITWIPTFSSWLVRVIVDSRTQSLIY